MGNLNSVHADLDLYNIELIYERQSAMNTK